MHEWSSFLVAQLQSSEFFLFPRHLCKICQKPSSQAAKQPSSSMESEVSATLPKAQPLILVIVEIWWSHVMSTVDSVDPKGPQVHQLQKTQDTYLELCHDIPYQYQFTPDMHWPPRPVATLLVAKNSCDWVSRGSICQAKFFNGGKPFVDEP